MPGRGLGYGALRYLGTDGGLAAAPQPADQLQLPRPVRLVAGDGGADPRGARRPGRRPPRPEPTAPTCWTWWAGSRSGAWSSPGTTAADVHRRGDGRRAGRGHAHGAGGHRRPLRRDRAPAAAPRPTSRWPGSTRRPWTGWRRRPRRRGHLPADPDAGRDGVPQPDGPGLAAPTSTRSSWCSPASPTPSRSPRPGSRWWTPTRCCAPGWCGRRSPSRSRSSSARATVPVTHHDWSGRSADAAERALTRLLAEDRAAGLDLAAAPLMRLALIRLSADRVRLVWTFHHILLDGWSAAQVFDEVCERYAALTGDRRRRSPPGRPSRLPALAGGAGHQRRPNSTGAPRWPDSPRPPNCPRDRTPLEAHRASSSGSVRVTLDETDSARLREMAQQSGLTMNTVAPGRLGAAAVPLQRQRRRGLRHHRLRPARRAARCGVHGRPVHQHPAHPGTGRRAARAAGLAARPADGAVGVPALRLRLPDRPPGLERSAPRDEPVRQHRGLRELPLRQRRPLPARPGHPAGTRPGADQLPAERDRRPRRTPHRGPGLRPGGLRRHDGRAAGRVPARPADGDGGRSGPPAGGPAAAHRGGTRPRPRGVRRAGRPAAGARPARGVRGAGGPHPARRGRAGRGRAPHLPGAERTRQPAGAAADRLGRGPGAVRRPRAAAHRGPDRGPAGRAQERRGLSAGRSQVPGRARRVPVRRHRAGHRAHHPRTGRPAAGGARHPDRAGRPRVGGPARRAVRRRPR